MGILAWIILGLVAGLIAKQLLPGSDPGGLLITMVLGIVGALLGGFLGAAMFGVDPVDGFFDISTWVAAILGAILILIGYRALAGRR
ncbi:GlsB/YeaQ/YmgE family stress response membrane protein [Pilimelia columellifera]|uniref:GlsB/YeaQ/YmgE family stress response membrane protein n=1 Tax=Pilimelia columellifera subsp. columellifera TaxID=706583 RepID=A0ABN3N9R0_9ACTN